MWAGQRGTVAKCTLPKTENVKINNNQQHILNFLSPPKLLFLWSSNLIQKASLQTYYKSLLPQQIPHKMRQGPTTKTGRSNEIKMGRPNILNQMTEPKD